MDMSLIEYRRLALMSLWTGLIATLGIIFAFIPNVELVILAAFLGGIGLGPKYGFIVAVLGEAIFSALNPIGSGLGFPVLYLFQIISVGLCGVIGGITAGLFNKTKISMGSSILLGMIGFCLTLFYDFITTLSFVITSGITEETLLGSIGSGLLFFIIHIASNTIIFALFGSGLIQLVNRQLRMHNLILI